MTVTAFAIKLQKAAVTGMFDLSDVLQHVVDNLYYAPFAQEYFVNDTLAATLAVCPLKSVFLKNLQKSSAIQ